MDVTTGKHTRWPMVRLGDVCEIKSGASDTIDAVSDGKYAFFDRSKKIKRSNRFLFDAEALIIAGEGTEFTPKYYSGKFDLHQRAYALYNFSEQVNIYFVNYYFLLRSDYLPSVAVGATVKSLRMRHFADFLIPLPPLAEQQRIVARLDAAFAAIAEASAAAEANLRNARALFDSYLDQVFSQRGAGWVERRLGDVCVKITDGTHASPKQQYNERMPNTFLYITSKNIRNNRMVLDDVAFIDKFFHDEVFARCQPSMGDVLLTKDGSNTGNVTLNTLDEPFTLLSSVALIKTKANVLVPGFLCFFLQSTIGQSQLLGTMSGTAIRRVILKDIKETVVPVPTINQQRQLNEVLMEMLDEKNKLIDTIQRKLAALTELKQSLLAEVFGKGE